MDEQLLPQDNKPKKSIIPIILSIVITAIIVSGGVYAWQQSKVNMVTRNYAQQNYDLIVQITDLQTQITELQQKKKLDDNWQTYYSEYLGFKVAHPKDWKVNLVSDEMVGFIPPDKESGIEYLGDITIKVFDNELSAKRIEDEINSLYSGATKGNSPMEVDGLSATIFKGVLGMLNSTVVYVSYDNKTIFIEDIGESHQEDGIFESMLESFNFISSFETYQNEELGFTFMYPESEIIIQEKNNRIEVWDKVKYDALNSDLIPEWFPMMSIWFDESAPAVITKTWLSSEGYSLENDMEMFGGQQVKIGRGEEILGGHKLYIYSVDKGALFINMVEWVFEENESFNKILSTFKFLK